MLYPSSADILISSVYQATRAPGRPLKGGAWSVSGISPQNRDDFCDIRSCIETVDRTHLFSLQGCVGRTLYRFRGTRAGTGIRRPCTP